jgi:hypothetical protein
MWRRKTAEATMRAVHGFLAAVLGAASPVVGQDEGHTRPEDVSVVCAVEYTRRMAIVASDYSQMSPPDTWWVSHEGQMLGPWTRIEIKREISIGRIPREVWVHPAEGTPGWEWAPRSAAFAPLPGDPELGPDDLGAGLRAMLSDCWVSDPAGDGAGQEVVWMLMLFRNGTFFPSRGRRDPATGREGFWFSRSSNERWSVEAGEGGRAVLRIPDIEVLDPHDAFPMQVIDRNTLVIALPGTTGLTFRRM